jgi:hypothetical protein
MKNLGKYKLVENSFDVLSSSDFPDDAIDSLRELINAEYSEEKDFIEALIDKIGEEITFSFKELLLKISNPEESSFNDDDGTELPPPDVVALNELRSCADLIRMYDNGKGKLQIQPDFQREVVWDRAAQTRFIDSLTKQLPIPSLCFSLDYKTQKRLVIDGLQRMQSIINFLTNDNWRLSRLDDIDERISGKKVSDIKKDNGELIEIVEDVTLPITVLRCDNSKDSHNNYLFTIFHRLNSGGKKLNNQEIRNCIYSGAFNTLLKDLNRYEPWRHLLNLKPNDGYRFKYEELILRFFAFQEEHSEYKGRLAKFLNKYMLKYKNLKKETSIEKEKIFKETIDIIFIKIAERKQLKTSITIIESLMHGISMNIPYGQSAQGEELRNKFKYLLETDTFSEENLLAGLANTDKVKQRLSKSREVFSEQFDINDNQEERS